PSRTIFRKRSVFPVPLDNQAQPTGDMPRQLFTSPCGRYKVRAMKITVLSLLFSTLALAQPAKAPAKKASPADSFLDFYNSLFLGQTRGSQEAQWVASTDVSDAHEGERTGANTLLAIFQGDKKVIESTRALLDKRKQLPPVVARQLDKILLAAAE